MLTMRRLLWTLVLIVFCTAYGANIGRFPRGAIREVEVNASVSSNVDRDKNYRHDASDFNIENNTFDITLINSSLNVIMLGGRQSRRKRSNEIIDDSSLTITIIISFESFREQQNDHCVKVFGHQNRRQKRSDTCIESDEKPQKLNGDLNEQTSDRFQQFCKEYSMNDCIFSKVNSIIYAESTKLTKELIENLEKESPMLVDFITFETVMNDALNLIERMSAQFDKFITKTDASLKFPHEQLKGRIKSIQELRKMHKSNLGVLMKVQNVIYDGCTNLDLVFNEIFGQVEIFELKSEAEWKLAVEAYVEQNSEIQQKSRLLEIRHQTGIGLAPKHEVGQKRKMDGISDEEIESWTFKDALKKVPNRLKKKENGRVPCEWIGCTEDFSRKDGMQRHYASIHMKIRETYKCNEHLCGLTFGNHHSLENHKRKDHGAELLHCDKCDKKFYNKRSLYQHTLSHSGHRYSCTFQECQQTFTETNKLNRHVKMDHSLTGKVFSKALELALLNNEDSRHLLDSAEMDANFIEFKFNKQQNIDHKSGIYFLFENTVSSFQFTTHSISNIDYIGKYTEKSNDPESRPKAHSNELKSFLQSGHGNPTKKLVAMKERVEAGAQYSYKLLFSKITAQYAAIIETSIIHSIGKTNLFNTMHGAQLPEVIEWREDLERVSRLGTYYLYKMIEKTNG